VRGDKQKQKRHFRKKVAAIGSALKAAAVRREIVEARKGIDKEVKSP